MVGAEHSMPVANMKRSGAMAERHVSAPGVTTAAPRGAVVNEWAIRIRGKDCGIAAVFAVATIFNHTDVVLEQKNSIGRIKRKSRQFAAE
jgi:hypothetical protein